MGRVMSLINITPDGFADAQYATADADFFEFTHGLLAETRTVAMGRDTFELFQDIWPSRLENAPEWQVKMAKALDVIPKTVFSSTLKATMWNNSAIMQSVDVKYVNSFRREGEGGLLTFGSLNLVSRLTEMKLIDDYYFSIQPLIAGKGSVRLFDKLNLDMPLSLKYVDSTQLKSGVHIIHYRRLF